MRETVRKVVLGRHSVEYSVYSANGDFWNQEGHPDQRPDAWWYHPLKHGVVTSQEIAEKYGVDLSVVERLAKSKMRVFDVYVTGEEGNSVYCLVYSGENFFSKKVAFSSGEFPDSSTMCLYRCLEIKYEDGRIERKFERSLRNLIPEEQISIRAALNHVK